jgi:hypothetical protein
MGIISSNESIEFEDSKLLFARVKRKLKSYNSAGLIDENDFHDYVMDALAPLGISGLMEEESILYIKDKKAKLPENFKRSYFFSKCRATSSHPIRRPQGGAVFYTDTTYTNPCEINCNNTKVTVRAYIEGIESIHNYNLDHELILVANRQNGTLHKHELNISNGYLNTGFDEGEIYMKYYGYPIDADSGLPKIPTIESIQRYIEYYIIYQLMQDWYWNGDIPDGITQKMAEAKQLYKEAFANASYEAKLPGFAKLIDSIRKKRNSLNVYKGTDNYGAYRQK